MLVLLLYSCESNDTKKLTEYQESFLLYSTDDTFSLLKNNLDTINFKVTFNETYDIDPQSTSLPYGTTVFQRESLTESIYSGKIRVYGNNEYHFSFKGNSFTKANYIDIDSIDFREKIFLNNTLYSNIYSINNGEDSLYFSKELGLIRIVIGNNETFDRIK